MKIHPQNIIIEFTNRNREDKMCRICYEEDEEISKLISPCACKGTMAFIHVHCLKKWIETKNVLYDDYKCEQCKEKLTLQRTYKEENFTLDFFYDNWCIYFFEYILYAVVVYLFSVCLYVADLNNDYKFIDTFDPHKDKILLNLIKNKGPYNKDLNIIYYASLSNYLISMGFYLTVFILTILKVQRRKLFFKINFLNFFITFTISSSFFLFYLVYLIFGDKIAAEMFIITSMFLSIMNYPMLKIYSYNHNRYIVLLNNKYNDIHIMNVTFNPLNRIINRNRIMNRNS